MNKHVKKVQIHEIKIPGGKVVIGPGTVPTSSASVSRTVISEMVSELKRASRDKIFEDKENYDPTSFRRPTR